jgi:hypothetical protein
MSNPPASIAVSTRTFHLLLYTKINQSLFSNPSGSSVGGEVKNWIDSHKTLVIALSCVIGGLIILSILGCCISSCIRRSKQKGYARQRRRKDRERKIDHAYHEPQSHLSIYLPSCFLSLTRSLSRIALGFYMFLSR